MPETMRIQAKKVTLQTVVVLERAVIYARVSGDDRGTAGRNLAGQLEMGRAQCWLTFQ